jgi:hypothetical protein
MVVTAASFISALDCERVSATFFGPYDKNEIPFIKVSTGDFFELIRDCGKDNAIYNTLHSVMHELQHYYQWYNDWWCSMDDKEADEEADDIATDIIYEYIDYRGFPFENSPKKKYSRKWR